MLNEDLNLCTEKKCREISDAGRSDKELAELYWLDYTSREKSIVTALFCDVVGSTSLAETMDPEDWGDLMGEALRAMGEVVQRFGIIRRECVQLLKCVQLIVGVAQFTSQIAQ